MGTYALPELQVMETVLAEMAKLTISERRRVLAWLSDYLLEVGEPEAVEPETVETEPIEPVAVEEPVVEAAEEAPAAEAAEPEEPAGPTPIADFTELYQLIAPKTSIQKVMTAAYWLQEHDGQDSWRASDISRCMKATGEPIKYLSNTLSIEAKRDDPRIVTLAKAGDSLQARKTFALSGAGEMFVEDRLGDATV
ncbi:MAG: hypothetical protein Q4G41_06065 [Coriobacteriales bacterium]|nr:hypothetical protein [Coriobacteriales bacterium]